jgi:uncharacterized protein (TIGR02246 family)
VKKRLLVALALVASAPPLIAQAEGQASDRVQIESIAKRFQEAWNLHDMDALASLMAEDVDFVTVVGAAGWEKGREEFRAAHAAVHKTMFKQSILTVRETHVRFLRPDFAIVHVLWSTKGDVVPDRQAGEPREGIFTWVVERRGADWQIVASQNTENKTPR